MIDWSKTIFHTCQEHLDWALAEKARLDAVRVPEGKVVFLGSNPSCSSPYEDPFSHCKSANKMISEWIPALGLTRAQVHFMNVANYKTPGNRALKLKEVKAEIHRLAVELQSEVVVTLGKTAELAMELVLDDYCLASEVIYKSAPVVIHMPHPSGRNRKLNDQEWVKQILAEAKVKIQSATKLKNSVHTGETQ